MSFCSRRRSSMVSYRMISGLMISSTVEIMGNNEPGVSVNRFARMNGAKLGAEQRFVFQAEPYGAASQERLRSFNRLVLGVILSRAHVKRAYGHRHRLEKLQHLFVGHILTVFSSSEGPVEEKKFGTVQA